MKLEESTPANNSPMIGPGLLPTDEPAKKHGPQFLKLAPNQKLSVICLSHVWTGAITHYYARRMHLHTSHDCPFCAHKSEPRFYAWLHVMTDDEAKQFILQLPSSTRPLLSKQFDVYGTLRGCHLFALRDGKHPNTPTSIEWRRAPETNRILPAEIDLTRTLLTLMLPTGKQENGGDNHAAGKPEASTTKGT